MSTGLVGAPVRVIRRSSDATARNSGNTGTTLTDDDQLTFPIGANEVWYFQLWSLVNAANTAMDIKTGFNAPSGCTVIWGEVAAIWNGVAVGSSPAAMKAITPDALSRGTLAGTSGFAAMGTAANGATPGNVTFQWAQSTSDAGDLKILANSVLLAWRLA